MIKRFIAIFLFPAFIVSCSKNSVTGRKQLKLLPESEVQTMAASEYQQFLSSNKVVSSSTNRDAEMVRRVGLRITKAVTDYYSQKGLSKELEG